MSPRLSPRLFAPSTVGVHVDERTVRWVRLVGSPDDYRVAALDEQPIAEGDEAAALAALVARRRGQGAVAVSHVDPLLVRHLLVRGQLPNDPAAHADWLSGELHRAGMIGDTHLLSVHAHLTSTTPDGTASDGGTALDLATEAAVEARRRLIANAGLVPAAIVSPWSAIARFSLNGDTTVSTDAGTLALAVWERGIDAVRETLAPRPEEDEAQIPARFAVALALARCGLQPTTAPTFLAASCTAIATAALARARAMRLILAGTLLLALTLAGSTVANVRAATRLTAAESELATLAPQVVALRAAEATLAGRRVAAMPSQRVAASATLHQLALAVPEDVWLDHVAFRADSSAIEIEGNASDEVAIATLLDRLDGSEVFSDARLDEARALYQERATTAQSRRFSVRSRIAPPPARR